MNGAHGTSLNVFHRHSDRIRMANLSMMINVFQAMILTDKERMMLTPTYHVFDMYQPFQGATPYPVGISGPLYARNDKTLPTVDVSATRAKDGKLYLALANLDPHRSAEVTTNIRGRAVGRVLTAVAMDSHNTFATPEAVHPKPFSGSTDRRGKLQLNLPPKSVVVVAVE
jgi:alpha-N-arabinofuranosidase